VKEAGLISARVAPTEVEATVPLSRPLGEVARPRAQEGRGGRLFGLAQVGVTLGATAIAFKASLLSLATGLPGQLALGALALVPLLALLLALGIALRGKRPEPDIHDRYLDYILGLALLGGATAAMWLLPGTMSIFFWSWRLDLVWLPFFAAGALTLLCGTRALWRYRVPVIFLFLAWPLPYVAARIPAATAAVAILGLGFILLVLPISLPRLRGRVRVGARPGGGLVAAALVCAAAILTTVADRQLEAAAPLLEPDGQSRLAAAATPATSVDGLLRSVSTNSPNLPSWGSSADRQTYRYAGSQATLPGTGTAGDAGIVVDVIAPTDGRVLALTPLTLATLQGYRLDASRVADLGGGVAAHVDRYRVPGERVSLLLVWWDWPVRSAAGSRAERIIIERLVPTDGATRDGDLLRFARGLAGSMMAQASAGS
jgi:hypothetical protein